MSRRRRAVKRSVLPDPKYRSIDVTKFINMMMWDGKKSTAEKIFYDAVELSAQRLGESEPLKVFMKALDNVKPFLEVKSRRVGGATYQVPIDVPAERQFALASRWLISFARQRKGQPMMQCLSAELIDAFKNQGAAIKKRDDTHKMAEANKAFAHYRW